MAELRIPEPSEKQCLFMADRHKYIGYGGARGGGKSWAVRVKAVLLCLRYAGIKVMIIRKTYPELQENHIIPLCEMLGCYADGKETVPGMMFSRTAPEDLDTEMEDHVCDEWRYMCMSRPVAPLRPVERRVMMNDPLGRN